MQRASVRRARGAAASAVEDSERALGLARSIVLSHVLHPALACHGRTLLAAGRIDEAESVMDELLAVWVPEREWAAAVEASIDVAPTLAALGRGPDFEAAMGRYQGMSKWIDAGIALARNELARAVELYAEIGSKPEEAQARLQLAATLVTAGRHHEAAEALEKALAFYRSVDAPARIREGEVLLAASG